MKKFLKELHDTWKEIWRENLSIGQRVNVDVMKEWIDKTGQKRTYTTIEKATIIDVNKDADIYKCHFEQTNISRWCKREIIKPFK